MISIALFRGAIFVGTITLLAQGCKKFKRRRAIRYDALQRY